jgi:hypothetical protein
MRPLSLSFSCLRGGRGLVRPTGVLSLAALSLLSVSAPSCGRNAGLSLSILTGAGDDPFVGASTVAITLQGAEFPAKESLAPVTGGKFDVKLELTEPPHDKWVYVTIEARDAMGQAVGRGRTPLLQLPRDNTNISVYVGRPGRVTVSPAVLPDDNGSTAAPVGRKALAAASLRGRRSVTEPGLGALIVGGVQDGGALMARAWRYSPVLHQLIDAGTPKVVRQGAVLLPSADSDIGQQAILWGGADPSGSLPTVADKYDPQVSDASALWQLPAPEVADPGAPGAYAPTVVELKESLYLVSGGSAQAAASSDSPLAQAVLCQRQGTGSSARVGITRLPAIGGSGPLGVARSGHTATQVTLGDGVGALLFGGLSAADRSAGKPTVELFREGQGKNTFSALSLMPSQPDSRRGHVATTLPSGKVLIAGGYSEEAAGVKTVLGSALLIDITAGTYQSRPTLLRTPRYAATLVALPKEILICGGYGPGPSYTPLADCELFSPDDNLAPQGDPVALPRARAGHVAVRLETDHVLLIGGTGEGNRAVAPIDLYTPR